MPRFPESFLEELADKLDIVDVISDYVTLKSSGRSNFVGLCPFHREKTPSFSVSADKQLYYCFGCHESGNIFTFVMKIENLEFYDCVKMLAERVGMAIPEGNGGKPSISKEHKLRLLTANRLAARYYHDMLYTPEGEEALAYLRGRGFTDAHIKRFGLGFAPNSYAAVTQCLREKGYNNSELIEAGLSAVADSGARDFFRNRIIYPIINTSGDVIAFGGRVMDKSEPKYLNTGDTPVFNKRKNLYGMNIIKKNGSKKAIVCEGYMDVISLNVNGFDYAVASLGTALTRDQIKLVHRFCPELYISYDGDRAGISATQKAIELTRAEKIKVKVIALQDGRDPDDYIRELGPQAYADAMNSSGWGVDYLIAQEMDKPVASDEDKARIAYNASQVAAKHSFDSIELEMHLRRISTATGFSLESLYRNVGQKPTAEAVDLTTSVAIPQHAKQNVVRKDGVEYTERMLLRLLCENPALCKNARQAEIGQYFTDDFRRALLEKLIEAAESKSPLSAQELAMFYVEQPEMSKELGTIFIDDTKFVDPSAYFKQSVVKLERDNLLNRREAYKQRLDQYVRQEIFLEDAELKQLLKEITDLDVKLNRVRIDT